VPLFLYFELTTKTFCFVLQAFPIIDYHRCNNNFNTMTRYLLTLIIGYLYATNVIGETYRDEECPECEYDDAKPIQVSNHVGYSGSVKLPKGSKSKSGTPKQTDSLPTPEQDEKTIEDDSVLWDQYVSKLYKKHDKGKLFV
jgi:hypothetical protein